MSSKKFVSLVMFLATLLMASTAALNYVIDPFNIFHTKFLKYQFQMNERFMKIEYLEKNKDKFDSYLIGSSRIGTTSPMVLSSYIPDSRFYNFTISSATIADEVRHIRYMINAGYKIKNLYLQIDVNDNMSTYLQQNTDYLRKPHPYVTNNSLNYYYLDYLFNFFPFNTKGKILKNLEGENDGDYSLETGTWSRPEKDAKIEQNCSEYVKLEPTFNTRVYPKLKNITTFKNFTDLRELVSLCSKNNIKLMLFVTPHNHKYLDEVIESEYYVFLKKLSEVSSFWNFSGYNSITTNNCNYYEHSHYRSKIGELIAARIFNDKNKQVPSDFGELVTTQNIDAHLAKLRAERARWRATHPVDVAEIEALKK